AERRFVGIVPIGELGRMARDVQNLDPVIVAADLACDCETIAPDASLLEAMHKLGVRGASVLPVVEPGTGRLLGLVTRANIISLYERSAAAAAAGEAGRGRHPAGGKHGLRRARAPPGGAPGPAGRRRPSPAPTSSPSTSAPLPQRRRGRRSEASIQPEGKTRYAAVAPQ